MQLESRTAIFVETALPKLGISLLRIYQYPGYSDQPIVDATKSQNKIHPQECDLKNSSVKIPLSARLLKIVRRRDST
jgi:hypothetical protein